MKKLLLTLLLSSSTCLLFGQEKNTPYVILVSFDGFRSDYASRLNLPNFIRFIQEGAAAEGLIPSFPSKTFPNHYTLVTGLYPGNHGLVDNSFFDPARKKPYSMRIREAVIDPAYYGGTPLWVLAKQQGLISASYFWVGSELKEEGLHPDYYFDYNQSVPFQQRVDQVISWLRLPENKRPHLITLYFSSPDTESHKYGPLAKETEKNLYKMDSLLGNLMHRVDSTKLPVNIILVSDHGMSELIEEEKTYIFLDELARTTPGILTVVNGGTQAHLYTQLLEQRDSIYAVLRSKAVDFSIYKREGFPARWHYNHERSGDLLIVAKPGKYIVTGDHQKMVADLKPGTRFGVHGYDPDDVPDMNGIFYARGPNIKSGSKIPALRNIHVYPLIAEILKLKSPEVDGSFNVLKPIYRK
jgi:predicted AlkP superfamily pyrophosphatase or phosphodiesterase